MSKFYGQVEGSAQTIASRRGFRDIKSSVQSYDGSVITRLFYDDDGVLNVNIQVSDDTSFYGRSIFTGTFEEFKDIFANRHV